VNKVTVNGYGGAYVPEHLAKEQDIPRQAGDRVHVQTPGGGGYGDPFERDPDAVLQDVRLARYSPEEAATLFGVVVHADLSGYDAAATAALRTRPVSGG